MPSIGAPQVRQVKVTMTITVGADWVPDDTSLSHLFMDERAECAWDDICDAIVGEVETSAEELIGSRRGMPPSARIDDLEVVEVNRYPDMYQSKHGFLVWREGWGYWSQRLDTWMRFDPYIGWYIYWEDLSAMTGLTQRQLVELYNAEHRTPLLTSLPATQATRVLQAAIESGLIGDPCAAVKQ